MNDYLRDNLPFSEHVNCVFHIFCNMVKHCKKVGAVASDGKLFPLLINAAKAKTEHFFESAMADIKKYCPAAAEYLGVFLLCNWLSHISCISFSLNFSLFLFFFISKSHTHEYAHIFTFSFDFFC